MKEITDIKDFDLLLENNKFVFVDFYAQWCGPCKKITPYIEELSLIYDNITFIKVDIEANKEIEKLSNNLKIESIPTFILFKNGKEYGRVTGCNKEKIENLLDI